VKMERDLLKKFADVLREGVAVKYGVIEQMRQQYPVASDVAGSWGVSISGYYAWRKRPLSLHDQQEPRLEAQVRAAHERTRETFGAERLQKELSNCGVQIRCSPHQAFCAQSLVCDASKKRKFKATTNSKHKPASRTEHSGPGLWCECAKSGLVRRHHIYRDR